MAAEQQDRGTLKAVYGLEDKDKPFSLKEADWDNYQKFRPAYPPSMWDDWVAYHKAHGGSLNAAHDIGAGPGIAAKELARFFPHVFVSDPGQSNTAAARRLLQPASSFTVRQQPAEVRWLDDGSVDMAVICMALHWVPNPEQALENVAASLRPGGTLAVCYYGQTLRFPEPGQDRLTGLYRRAINAATGYLIGRGVVSPIEAKALCHLLVGLDGVAVSNDLFQDVRRVYLNIEEGAVHPFCFTAEGAVPLPPSQIGAGEKIEYRPDEGWRREVEGARWFRDHLSSSNAPFGEEVWEIDEWAAFERAVEDEFGGKVVVEWPVGIILASRR
jgi:SAM-dependent methyltransferase